MLATALWAVTIAAGCSTYTATLRPTDQVKPDLAYFYGRFQVHAKRTVFGTNTKDSQQTMGFVLRCDHGVEYTIRFSPENRVQVIGAWPTYCALSEVIFTRADDQIVGRQPVIESGFKLAAGTAYYLGDYVAESTAKSAWRLLTAEYTRTWLLTAAEDNYEAATAELKRTFTNLAGLSTENRMLMARKCVVCDALKLAAQDTPDDVVSPERAARLAGFTKRRYATPAECEAACPKSGECFPFRHEGNPAMTCVVRCRSDKDCPQGLACNCPDGDGVACRAIASAPDDRMAGICLSVEAAGERR